MCEEIKLKDAVDMVTITGTKIILNQMVNCICKIKLQGANGTGFFSTVTF